MDDHVLLNGSTDFDGCQTDHGRTWSTIIMGDAYQGLQWSETMVNRGCLTMKYHGIPWSSDIICFVFILFLFFNFTNTHAFILTKQFKNSNFNLWISN